MRDIRFRAYIGGKMRQIEQFDLGAWNRTKDYPVMQYTGLTDKNGVEIYEGDVVRYEADAFNNTGPIRHKSLFEVRFEDGGFVDMDGGPLVGLLQEYGNATCQVIGNIYEHPHLLETTS